MVGIRTLKGGTKKIQKGSKDIDVGEAQDETGKGSRKKQPNAIEPIWTPEPANSESLGELKRQQNCQSAKRVRLSAMEKRKRPEKRCRYGESEVESISKVRVG